MHDGEVRVDEPLVRDLLRDQFPALAGQPLKLVEPWGTDNALWRLGEDLLIRLPRIYWATDQIELEATWLPRIAAHLPVAIPEPVAIGQPGGDYPYKWAIHRWLPGEPASPCTITDAEEFAVGLSRVVRRLQETPTDGAPTAVGRARPLQDYADNTLVVIESARGLIDTEAAIAVWDEALAAEPFGAAGVWVHGDLEGNCLVRHGRLAGLVDWGSACVGDPAVDIQVIWSPLFTTASRQRFLKELEVDEATVLRSRGAAIQQACAALPYYLNTYPLIVERSRHKLAALGVSVNGRD
jgi:aminoglycoside phosphotransferase (APT) family kinase protein